MRNILQWIRDLSGTFFHRFGIHCATHQIRLILISGLVITSLFYPALAIYSSSRFKPLSHVSTHILDLLSPDSRSLAYFDDDLDNFWSGQPALQVRDDPVARARCGLDKTIRIERLLITTSAQEESGVINKQTLLTALDLERRLTRHLSSNRQYRCLTHGDRQCIVFSPLEFWSHEEHLVQADANPVQTINMDRNVTVAGVPLTPRTVLAGRELNEHAHSTVDFAAYLVITYMFHEDDCTGTNGHNAWLEALNSEVPQSIDITVKQQGPVLLALEFVPHRKSGSHVSALTVLLYVSYIFFFIFFSGSMRRMNTVHSRVGLCFTGLVEILVSTITSLSVCAIGGLRITMVPWGLLPIVIVFVGAENMFRLIDEVVKTPISLPVKERIGVGLSRAGTSNTMRVVSYNSVLGVIAFFASGAIRQFCVFAIVVLVAHWFLIHTFFVAVLSIDIQRLELADLLRLGSKIAPPDAANSAKSPVRSSLPFGILSFVKGLRSIRLTRNISLFLMLAMTGALYYSTLPAPLRMKEDAVFPQSRASVLRTKAENIKLEFHAQSRTVWRTLNPDDDRLVHMRTEAPAILTLRLKYSEPPTEQRIHRSRYSFRALRSLWWLCKIIVLPISATISCLYALLLYLLKGTDQLENRHSNSNETADGDMKSEITEGIATFKTLPRVFPSDVAFLASSADGRVIASVSAENEVFLWLGQRQFHLAVDLSDLILQDHAGTSLSSTLTSVAVSPGGFSFSVGTSSGLIGLWDIVVSDNENTLKSPRTLTVPDVRFPTTLMEFLLPQGSTGGGSPSLLANYGDGTVVQWECTTGSATFLRPTSRGAVTKTFLTRCWNPTFVLISFALDDGSLEIIDNSSEHDSSVAASRIVIRPGWQQNPVTAMSACVILVHNSPRLLVAATTEAGATSLWDVSTNELIAAFDDGFGPEHQLRLLPIPAKACSRCNELPLCSFVMASSVGHVVSVALAYLSLRCSCLLNRPLASKSSTSRESTIGRRSRSGSFVSSTGDVPRIRSRHASMSDEFTAGITSFPVSGHGIHSRRGSDKESRRICERLERASLLPEGREQGDTVGVPSDSCGPTYCGDKQASRLWSNLRMVHLKEMTCERGGWDILKNRLYGVRRKPRVKDVVMNGSAYAFGQSSASRQALSASVLDRWELWMLDLSRGDMIVQVSPLSSISERLREVGKETKQNPQKTIPRLSFTRLSPFTSSESFCLAGFGNTVGIVQFSER